MKIDAQILRIERLSNTDGKGLRTVIFFKGCPLRCAWCSTPESQQTNREWYYKVDSCIQCGRCVEACPEKAISMSDDRSRIIRDISKCKNHYECVRICPTNSIGVYGKEMTLEEVMKIIRKDEIFYYHSGGGVTLSGGCVLTQSKFAKELLIACKDTFINTSAELEMHGSYKNIQELLPYLDTFYVDIKCMDPLLHKKWTGVDNDQILRNIKKASASCKKDALHVRVPLIWNINDDMENILKTAEFCNELDNCVELEFLPYHRLGTETYRNLNREYKLSSLPSMSDEEARERVEFLMEYTWPFDIKISGKEIHSMSKA